jgi:FMN phosphatase YigB (HAD superfamily)
MGSVRAVVFDAGETLFDETRVWHEWARRLGVTPLTMAAALGATIERGVHHREAFELIHPGFDYDGEVAAFHAHGDGRLRPEDLYPDALPTIEVLKKEGFLVAVVGNQPSGATDCLADLEIGLDLLTTSSELGFEKPDPMFFTAVASTLRQEPAQVAYIGDRIDNDVLPAQAAGLVAIHLKRGPWAHIQLRETPSLEPAIDSLSELPDLLRDL